MEYVVSKDGTRIAYGRSGEGPSLVLVHGTGIDHSYWDLIAPKLERDFSVYIVERRGRGKSGETTPYAIQREFEDIAAAQPACHAVRARTRCRRHGSRALPA